MGKDNKKKRVQAEPANRKKAIAKTRAERVTVRCSACNKPFSYDPNAYGSDERPDLCRECFNKQRAIVYRGTCKDCGKQFYVRAGEAEWLASKGMAMPKRCYECRNYRRIQKANEKQAAQ